MNFTVGQLEDMLRKFPKSTVIHVGCKSCSRSSSGQDIIDIADMTNQTYGYIELTLNNTYERSHELTADERLHYEKTIKDLEAECKKYRRKSDDLESIVNSIKTSIDRRLGWINNNIK